MKRPLRPILCVTAALIFIAGCAKPPEGIVTSGNGLVLRHEPSAKAARVGFLPRGSVVAIRDSGGPEETLHGTSGRWLRISHGGKDGWVFGGFVKPLKSKLARSYQSGGDRYLSFLEYENGDFEMTVNLCEGTGTIEGTCSRAEGGLSCTVSKTDFTGFRGEGIKGFRFTRSGASIVYHGEGIGCGPNEGDALRGI